MFNAQCSSTVKHLPKCHLVCIAKSKRNNLYEYALSSFASVGQFRKNHGVLLYNARLHIGLVNRNKHYGSKQFASPFFLLQCVSNHLLNHCRLFLDCESFIQYEELKNKIEQAEEFYQQSSSVCPINNIVFSTKRVNANLFYYINLDPGIFFPFLNVVGLSFQQMENAFICSKKEDNFDCLYTLVNISILHVNR